MTFIGADGSIGEGQPVALSPADHGLDCVTEEPACRSVIAEFARPLQVFPGDLEGVLKQLGKRNDHGPKTNSNYARSISASLALTEYMLTKGCPPRYMIAGN
jgi:hypothetical protein